jgi:DNA primase
VRFDEHFLDEIKSRLRPSDVIGKTVKLRRQGREYVGLSPFTKEKTPSFYVNDDKGQFFDFSSGKTGDIISFLQESERLTFVEAVERLAAEAGVPMPAVDPRAVEQEKVRQGLAEWLDLAAHWFEAELRRPAGREARAYLERRGLPEKDWARFRLGFSPSGRTALKDYLIAKGGRPGELVETGLLIAPEEGGAPYDRFRDRIIFPIADARGRVISFGGRAMDPQARAKYLNGPETSIFHKGHHLYGLAEARKIIAAAPPPSGSADEQTPLVVVEGYMDVIACQRAGVAAVAAMGTALGEDQMDVLWRHHPEPTICLDSDRAGRAAANRLLDRALPLLKPGRSFKFVLIDSGKDPDEVLREQGAAALRGQLAAAAAFVDTLFRRELELEPLDTPERRAGLKARLRQAAQSIADKDLAQAYREALFERFDAQSPSRAPRADSPPRSRPWTRRRGNFAPEPEAGPPIPETRAAAKRLASGLEVFPAALAKYALDDPGVLDSHLEDDFTAQGFGDSAVARLTQEIVRLRLEQDHLDSASLARHLAACGFSELLTDIHRAAAASGAPFLGPDVSLESARSQWSLGFTALSRLAALETSLIAAKQDLGGGGASASLLMRLKTERDALRRAIRTGTIWEPEGS